MSKLDYITIKGFKSIKSIEKLELRPINLLIGANGAGKSNFISAFEFLRSVLIASEDSITPKDGVVERMLHFGSQKTSEIQFGLFFPDDDSEVKITLKRTLADTFLVDFDFELNGVSNLSENFFDVYDFEMARTIRRLTGWKVFRFHHSGSFSPLRRTQHLSTNRRLQPSGSNLPSMLYLFQEKFPTNYSVILKTVQQVAPFIKSFVLHPMSLNESKIRLEWEHTQSEDYLDVSSLSDGTLRFIALAVLFLQPVELRPSIILIDEPELGLHPAAITLLASMLKQASVDTQVIVSTQSALLLDHFEPEDVLVADCIDGGTQLRRLSSEDLDVWLEDYSLGQLWEKNYLGGRPGNNF